MNRRTMGGSLLLLGTLLMAATASAQKLDLKKGSADVAVTYTLERAKIANTNCGCFWLNGASVDGAYTLSNGLGLAVNLTGEHASNITPGVNLGKITYLAGPRFTGKLNFKGSGEKRQVGRAFGELLIGGTHGFDSVFPGTNAVAATANSFALQLGGGVDIAIKKGFAVRAVEMDYVHTSLPNNGSNSQNDFRLAFGVAYHFKKK